MMEISPPTLCQQNQCWPARTAGRRALDSKVRQFFAPASAWRRLGQKTVSADSSCILISELYDAKQKAFHSENSLPNCRNLGEARCEDYQVTQRGKFDRTIIFLSDGFEAGGDLDHVQQVICSGCRSLIPI
jgi:hypothetical protein